MYTLYIVHITILPALILLISYKWTARLETWNFYSKFFFLVFPAKKKKEFEKLNAVTLE